MNISGVVVRCRPDQSCHVQTALAAMEGVEVHAASEDGHLVVTIDREGSRDAADTYVALHDIDSVLSVSLVYAYDDAGDDIPGLFTQETQS